MTSGNVSEEPMAHRDDEAHQRLARIADLFLEHDRAIENRCDDSVAAVIAGQATVFRRARGYVPRPVRLRRALARPVLACGAHLKNAVCLADGREAWLGPHVGDLETLEACQDFERGVERLERFVGIAPEVVAHDLHPDYHSTRYALARPERVKIGVQHHHAHIAAAMAEHGLEGPVIGLAWDGTGYGTDGTAWVGELLVADGSGFERVATFRPLALAGGDAAIREVWRLALAALDDAFDGDAPLTAFPLFASIAPSRIAAVRRLIASGRHAPAAHGVGRWFDALGAAFLGCARARHEGEVAILWNHAADPAERRRYPFTIEDGAVRRVDLRPLVRAAACDFLDGVSAGTISGRFHNTLGAAAAEMVARATDRAGRLPVVLTGGCFQNARLVDEVLRALEGRTIVRHADIPPGDGGIALGQALVADAIARRSA
jgi:hydrogenase maturation protein HypF